MLNCTVIKGPLVVESDLEKSSSIIYLALEDLGISSGYHISVEFNRNIEIGKGLSSSSADMLAALRALQEVFGFLLDEVYVSRLFQAIEPHDALQYNSCVVYNHRQGRLLDHLGHIPHYKIIAVDDGGSVDTKEYNAATSFTDEHMKKYDALLTKLKQSFIARDAAGIAACAAASSEIHASRTDNKFLKTALDILPETGALGLLATHSGTCAGFLYPEDLSLTETDDAKRLAERHFGKHVFTTRTLKHLK